MARLSVLPRLMCLLEAYLDHKASLWSIQPDEDRTPTLPATTDGKVNVRRLVEEMGLNATAEQHFYNKPELTRAVNLIASVQGLKGIGSRVLQDADDEAARARITQLAARAKTDKEGHAAARVHLTQALARVRELEGENARLKARLEHVRATGMLVRVTPAAETLG